MEASPISPDMGAAPGSVAEAGLKSVRLAAQPEGGDVAAKAPGGGKMHRAGRKAAVMSILEKNLGRRDPLKKGDLERVVAFLHSDPGARTQAEIARCLVMLKNFQFLEPYSDEQRRQLAGIAIYTRFSRGSHPAFSRAICPRRHLPQMWDERGFRVGVGTRGLRISGTTPRDAQRPDSHGGRK